MLLCGTFSEQPFHHANTRFPCCSHHLVFLALRECQIPRVLFVNSNLPNPIHSEGVKAESAACLSPRIIISSAIRIGRTLNISVMDARRCQSTGSAYEAKKHWDHEFNSFKKTGRKANHQFSPFRLLLSVCLRIPKSSTRSVTPSVTGVFGIQEATAYLEFLPRAVHVVFRASLFQRMPTIADVRSAMHFCERCNNLLHEVLFPFLNF